MIAERGDLLDPQTVIDVSCRFAADCRSIFLLYVVWVD